MLCSLRLQFGRCSVSKFYQESVELLESNLDLFHTFIEREISLDEAPECYRLFEQGKIGKTVFILDKENP